MKRTFFVMIAMATLLFLAGNATADEVKDTIRVGDAGAFTGDAAAPCMEIFNSAQIAVDEWNAKGGIQGAKIEHIMGDDAMDPAQAVNVAHKFVADDLMYGVIGPPMSHTAQATLKIYGTNDLACITTAASKPELTEQGYNHFFRVNARNDAHGPNCARFIVEELGAEKVAILNEKVAYTVNLANQTIKALKELGVTDIMQDTIVGGAKDYSAVMTKVKSYDPDVLFFMATAAPDHAIAVRQMKEFGMDAHYFATEGGRDKKDFIEAAEGAAEGAYIYHFSPDIYAIPEAKSYIEKYEKQYGSISGFGPPAYEAMNIMLMCMDRAAEDGKITRKEVIDELHKVEGYEGILGFPITFNEKGDLAGGATYFFKVVDGDFKQVGVMSGNM